MRIDIQPDQVEVQVRPNAIAYLTLDEFKPDPRLTGPVETLVVPARLKRTGREIRMIVEGAKGGGRNAKPDRSLVRLILTALRYKDLVLKARGQSIKELCAEEGVSRSYFTRALRLTYLAPDIIQAVLQATQPLGLSAAELKRASKLPLNWDEQRTLLGFS